MLQLFETGPNRYQPDSNYIYATDPNVRVDQRLLARFVGLVALGLPVVMLTASALGNCFYISISHFYYAQFWGDVFVGALVFIGAFLISYRGASRSESRLATIAGLAAFAVAALPTSERGCSLESFSGRALADFNLAEGAKYVTITPASDNNTFFLLFKNADTLHFSAAAVLFAFLAYYSLFVFTRKAPEHTEKRGGSNPAKRNRNWVYYVSGGLIVFSMLVLAAKTILGFEWWNTYRLTFWFEALALWAFGTAWMVKGRWFFGLNILDEADREDLALRRAS
ncbi:MAG: hypothetical protein ACPGGK_02580 [Pikeienuella sp.]